MITADAGSFAYLVSRMHVGASKGIGVGKGVMDNQENETSRAVEHSSEKKARNRRNFFGKHAWIFGWILGGLTMALVSLKIYYLREMIAALVIFSAMFAIVAIAALVLFVVDRVTQRTFAWAELGATQLAHSTASGAGAIVEAFRRWRVHNLHSRTAE